MNHRHVRTVCLAVGFSAFLAADVSGQSRRPIRRSYDLDRPPCLDSGEAAFTPRRAPRVTLVSYFESAGFCGTSPAESPSSSSPEKSARLHPSAGVSDTPATAEYDQIEGELRNLQEPGLRIVLARRQVLAILRENTSCSAWFAQAEPLPFTKLASLHFRLDGDGEFAVLGDHTSSGVFYREPYVARTQQNVGAGSTITLNVHGAFFVSRAPARAILGGSVVLVPQMDRLLHVGNYAGGSLNAQVTTLLHEFAHVVDLLPVDMGEADSAFLSTQNTEVVLQHCRKQIEASAERAILLPLSLAPHGN